jgi:hypothetical protein
MVREIVNDIIKELQQEDYESVMGDDDEGGEFAGIGGDEPTISPQVTSEPELDLDSILDKISKSGMGSLTPEEKRFLDNI